MRLVFNFMWKFYVNHFNLMTVTDMFSWLLQTLFIVFLYTYVRADFASIDMLGSLVIVKVSNLLLPN